MKLPGNSLGISDAKQFHLCPKAFHRGMLRHTRDRDETLIAEGSKILNYGTCLHDAAEIIVRNPSVYLDDVVDAVWAKWGMHLDPEHHAELRDDVAVVIERTIEAEQNLELVCAEEDWKVPVFVGRKDGSLDEEEGQWYYYRFRIDALYRKKDDPTHYVIRDFKTYRRRRFQDDVDNDMQLTAYDFGIREAIGGDVSEVTVWLDQVKFTEVFTSRTEKDRIKFAEYIESTIKAVLDVPSDEMAETIKLNEYCGYCPLLASCGVIRYCNNFALNELGKRSGASKDVYPDLEQEITDYEMAKSAKKAIDSYVSQVSDHLKRSPGQYAGRTYYVSTVSSPKWRPSDVIDIVGEEAIKDLPQISKQALKKYLDDPVYHEQLMSVRSDGGYERLNSRESREGDDFL